MAKLRRDTGGPLDDDAALLLMARQVLGGPSDAGRSSYQLSLSVCERCRQGYQHGSGDVVEVTPEVVAMADCDAQHLGQTHVGAETPTRVTQAVPPAVRRRVIQRDSGKCGIPGCRHSQYLDVHHVNPRAEGGDHNPEKLITLCGVHHRAAHEGRLLVTGKFSEGFCIRHADRKSYGAVVSPQACDAREKAFLGLRKLGFRETETRRALDVAVMPVDVELTTRALLGRALVVLTQGVGR